MADYYIVKPSMSRIVAPQTLFLLFLEAFAFLGIIINLSLFNIEMDLIILMFVFVFTILFVVIFPDYLKYKTYDKISFYFYGDKLMYNSFAIPYDKILNVYEGRTVKPLAILFDNIFKTGTIIIEMYDDSIGQNRRILIENISGPHEMTNYIIQLIARYRSYKGTSL
jgi:hypothetical protein